MKLNTGEVNNMRKIMFKTLNFITRILSGRWFWQDGKYKITRFATKKEAVFYNNLKMKFKELRSCQKSNQH
jgi:hypothetical protein